MASTSGRTNQGWSEYENLVLHELKRHSDWLSTIEKDITNIRVEIAMLKVKAGIWGVLGGIIPASILIFAQMIKLL